MRNEKRERCRRDAVHASGLADGARTGGIKLLADFVGKTAQLRNEAFLAKAPAKVVNEMKPRRDELEVLIAKAKPALTELG